jgi:hypothetical protein
MPVRKIRIAVYASVATLCLVLLLPGFCECPTCVVVGSKAEPCTCTVLGVYLGKKALRSITGKGKSDCAKR